jgi:hypothetical protein
MKPEKFDILKEILHLECLKPVGKSMKVKEVDIVNLWGYMAKSDIIFNNYDESISLTENIENFKG